MTVATNALLEGRTARTALIATDGFTDVIELGRQARAAPVPSCATRRPPPLVPAELRFARARADGPGRAAARARRDAARERSSRELARAQPQAVAVVAAALLRRPGARARCSASCSPSCCPTSHVSLSCELVGTFREYERTATTALDAALSPLLAAYLRRLCARRGARRAARAADHAVLRRAHRRRPRRRARRADGALRARPAASAGALLLAELAGEPRRAVLRHGRHLLRRLPDRRLRRSPRRPSATIAGRPLALPALDIHTVGAGGGSIAWRDSGGALRVGPASAGADPGPGLLRPRRQRADGHRRQPAARPAARGLAARGRPRRSTAPPPSARSSSLARELDLELLACAEGIVRVAEAEMLGALRVMTVERGIDPRGFALMPFGGAGPLHAAALARELGISRVLCPRASGVLCALGLAAAAPRRDVARTVMLARRRAHRRSAWRGERARCSREACAALGAAPARVRVRYELRYRGQSFELPVERSSSRATRRSAALDPATLREASRARTSSATATATSGAEVELVNIRVSVWGAVAARCARWRGRGAADGAGRERARSSSTASRSTRERRCAASSRRAAQLAGPALCALPEATLLVPPGWSGEVDAHGTIAPAPTRRTLSALDPIELQVVTGALRAACEEMGVVLIRSAHSSNIKERRDASTALFDADGQMVMQAEHIPVHLGAMPAAVAAVLGERHAPGRLVDPQRPVRRRHPPARHHRHHAGLRATRPAADRLRRQPRAPRRRRRRACPGRCRPTAARSRRRAS